MSVLFHAVRNREVEPTIIGGREQVQDKFFGQITRYEGRLELVVRLDAEQNGEKSNRTQACNGLFFPTVPTEANLELSAVFHRTANTTCLRRVNKGPIERRAGELTKQLCSNTSEAYCGSLRSGGHSGIPSAFLAAIQTRYEFRDIRAARVLKDARAR